MPCASMNAFTRLRAIHSGVGCQANSFPRKACASDIRRILSRPSAKARRWPTYNRGMSRAPLAVILAAARTPIATFGGAFKDVSAVDLGAVAAREAIARSGVTVTEVDDVFMGCVLQAGSGMNVARQVALKAGLPVTV